MQAEKRRPSLASRGSLPQYHLEEEKNESHHTFVEDKLTEPVGFQCEKLTSVHGLSVSKQVRNAMRVPHCDALQSRIRDEPCSKRVRWVQRFLSLRPLLAAGRALLQKFRLGMQFTFPVQEFRHGDHLGMDDLPSSQRPRGMYRAP
jgi:hypothetical protein